MIDDIDLVSPRGSTFESYLEDEGALPEVDEVAVKRVIAWMTAQEMERQGMSKTKLAKSLHTSRAQVDRLLDPDNSSVSLHTLYRVAKVFKKKLRIEFVDGDAGDSGYDNRSMRVAGVG